MPTYLVLNPLTPQTFNDEKCFCFHRCLSNFYLFNHENNNENGHFHLSCLKIKDRLCGLSAGFPLLSFRRKMVKRSPQRKFWSSDPPEPENQNYSTSEQNIATETLEMVIDDRVPSKLTKHLKETYH